MNEAMGYAWTMPSNKKVLSRTEALWLMLASAAAAIVTTVAAVSNIVAYFAGPVTLTLPVAATHHAVTGLHLGAAAHFASIEATIPSLPLTEATLLAWAGVLNLVGILAVFALLFALVLILVAAVLQFGGRLQKDTEGLV